MKNTLLFILICLYITFLFKDIPPYMDEVFHIPQAQRYCLGNWNYYDPLLTTPPGLYLTSTFLCKIWTLPCSIAILRMTNVIYSIGIYLLVSLSRSKDSSLSISLFPVSFFFHFLYYTDSGSTFWVLLCLHWSMKRKYEWSGLAGFVSIWFRQTNILWCAFAFVNSIVLILKDSNVYKDVNCETLSLWSSLNRFRAFIESTLYSLPLIIKKCKLFILDLILFSIFVWWNKGIVLGDKSNHVPTLHIPQLYYFVSFSTFFLSPWITKECDITVSIFLVNVLIFVGFIVSVYGQVAWVGPFNSLLFNILFFSLIIVIIHFIFGDGSLNPMNGFDMGSFPCIFYVLYVFGVY